ncbi:SPOR domain-containing protein [Pseudomonas entomophila]|uniref:SPOR domain-containing protein n=1 Tax=Pseudomonas entomophila TaxID=312306 RepID=UPI0023D882A4|nr:SPOR domain-containing protein [Pseudomonas entomophila]MDF0734061.1 SPOR domain-containing protein [Pseudomonas entomophila]
MAAKKKPAPKRGASRYQAPAKQPIPGWVWLAVGLTVGAFIVFLMKLEPGGEDIKRAKPEQQKPAKVAEADKGAAVTPQQPVKPKYDFYTLLPESEVIVPPEAVPEKTPPVPAQPVPTTPVTPAEAAKIDTARAQAALLGQTPPPAPPVIKPAATTQFFLQAGSFRKEADADKVRAQIILLGQVVKVESGTVKDETWYRVLVGPFSNREQLTVAQKQLAGAGFSNLLLQQRQTRQ